VSGKSSAARGVGLRAPLRRPDFRRMWLAQAISDFGDGLTSLTLLLLAMSLTGSAGTVAEVMVAIALPDLTIGLVAGVFVDRWERRATMIGSDLARAAIVLGLVLVQSEDALALMLALAAAEATVGAFFTPARMALLPEVLPESELFAANSLSQLTRMIASVSGATLAGILFGTVGAAWPAFAIDAATFLASAAIVLGVSVRSRVVSTEVAASPLTGLRVGLSYAVRTPVLFGTVAAATVVMLGAGVVNVLWVPLFQVDLHVPTVWYGASDGAQVAAMLMATAASGALASRYAPTRLVPTCLVGLGLAVAAVSICASFPEVLALLFAVGLALAPLNAAISTIIQSTTPRALLGRMGALLNAATSSAYVISLALAGILGTGIGVRPSFALAGVVVLAAAPTAALLYTREPASGEAGEELSGAA